MALSRTHSQQSKLSNHSASRMSSSGRILVPGAASGDVIFSDMPLSFMMGVDSKTGTVIDAHHPLRGQQLHDKIVVLPCGRGSCSGSGVILELLLEGCAPAALVFSRREEILTLGVLLAKVMFSKSLPVVLLENPIALQLLKKAGTARITDRELYIGEDDACVPLSYLPLNEISLSEADRRMLEGIDCSSATRMAMEVIVAFAAIQEAKSLISVTQVHVDACCYVGKSSLLIPETLHSQGARFVVPTTCNSLDVDRERWRELGADPILSETSSKIGDVYLVMGATMSFTCAPYLLDTKPSAGEQIGWGESNAVVFANSVLGAWTQKYPDHLEVMIGLTGRAPKSGCHRAQGRLPRLIVQLPVLNGCDDSLFPLLGYHIGGLIGSDIPLILGLEGSNASTPNLKDFGAGFATTSSAPMFHIRGVTPEAAALDPDHSGLERISVQLSDLCTTWNELNTAKESHVDLISLGNPHFALEEFEKLAVLCTGREKREHVSMIITTSRHVYSQAAKLGHIDIIEQFGATLITDTCWCMIQEPVIPILAKTIMTNSAKYAHYGPGLSKRNFHFGSLASCVDAACSGERSLESGYPSWLFKEL